MLTPALTAALAVSVSAQDEVPVSAIGKFKTIYPKTTFKETRESQVSGLYEAAMGEDIVYTDELGRYFTFGCLFGMQQQVNLTAQCKLDSKRTEFLAQRLGQTIKTVKGDGSRVLAVFSGPDCPYCKQPEGGLARLDNVTIYTLLYPLESLHPEAKTKAVSVWCAPNKAKVWSKLVLAGKKLKLVACSNPVSDNLVLGSKLGVMGTPTLITADDRVLPSPTPAEKIDQ